MCSVEDSAHQGVERKIHRFPAVVTAFMLPSGNSRSTSHILNEGRRFPYDKCKMSRPPREPGEIFRSESE